MDVRNVWVYEFEGPTIRRAQVYADTAVLRDTAAGLSGDTPSD